MVGTITPCVNADRAARIQAITDAARVREHLGQAALHRRLPGGEHEIIFRGRRFTGTTLEAAVDQARAGIQYS
ncbi:MAG: hypothetical protein ABIP48_02720 [Planctomycetota bacterium]